MAMAGVEAYTEYLAEVERRLRQTKAQLDDFMISPVADMPGLQEKAFFARLADARKTLSTAKTIVIPGVYAYGEAF